MRAMNPMKRRLQVLEAQRAGDGKRLSPAESDRRQDELWAAQGTSRAEIVTKYGSVPKWALARLCGVDHLGNKIPESPILTDPDGLTAQERLMRMLGETVT